MQRNRSQVFSYCVSAGLVLLGIWLLVPRGPGRLNAAALSRICLPLVGQRLPPSPNPTVYCPTPQALALAASRVTSELIEPLVRQTGGNLRVSYHASTGMVRFLGTDLDHPLARPAGARADAPPEVVARAFLASYGSLFGLHDQASNLALVSSRPADGGRDVVRFQQRIEGLPVLGGEWIVQLDGQGNVVSVSGEALPSAGARPPAWALASPGIDREAARERALDLVAEVHRVAPEALAATEPELWVYHPALLGAPGLQRASQVWRLEVRGAATGPIRELVLVDAQLGTISLHFNQVEEAKNRRVYDNRNDASYPLPGPFLVRAEGGPATGIADVDNAYDYTGDTYDFDLHHLGRDRIDNQGMALISTMRYCVSGSACPYQNAFWNGQQMVFGEGFASGDDVVAHELTHGVTGYESHLFYYMQAGAINESLSDIFGEFVDLTNGHGNDSAGVRWLMGEDLSVGAVRSMENPPAFGDADRMNSPLYYCGTEDRGGVHHNSGVGNKTAYLMTDGGTFDGHTVAGLGITKVARIYYEAQTHLLTSAADYADLYDALIQATTNLIGTGDITSADLAQVIEAVRAAEMHQQPASCPAPEVVVCENCDAPINLFFDDLENPSSGNWAEATIQGANSWYYPQTSNPLHFDATYATSGQYNLWGYVPSSINDSSIQMTRDIHLPASAYMHFRHAYSFGMSGANAVDGGVLEYSTDGGSTWNDTGPLFVANGYGGTLGDSPLIGRAAFVGVSHGYIATRLSLASLAGQSVRFRFRIGSNSLGDDYGWFIDDVRIYTCPGAPAPTLTPTLPGPTPTLPGATPTATGQAYADDFSDPGSGWYVGEDVNNKYSYEAGEYEILVRTGNRWAAASAPASTRSNYTLEADMRLLSANGSGYGLIFDISGDWSRLYLFEVVPGSTSYYSLWRVCTPCSTVWTPLVDWTSSSDLGLNTATNRLKVVRSGSSISLYANEHLLTTVSDGTYAYAGISLWPGLAALTYAATPATARFDSFRVEGQLGALTATSAEASGKPGAASGSLANRRR